MKQKIVVRLPNHDDKCRSKALRVAVEIPGVESAAVEGEEMVVIGEGIDLLKLAQRLKKKLRDAQIMSAGAADGEHPASLTFHAAEPPAMGLVPPPIYGLPQYHQTHHYEISDQPSCCNPCTIM